MAKVAESYPDVELNNLYVDNCAMQLAIRPTQFDVIVTGNLFGDILSDEAAVVGGSIGMMPSASIGTSTSLYEPIHGSAPDIAGKGIANPCALLLGAAQMLDHLGQVENAERLRKAIVATMEAKDSLTGDLGGTGGTMDFARAIASRL